MGIIGFTTPQFLAAHAKDIKFQKIMFIKRGGEALHNMGNVSRYKYDVELICISNETSEYWIGNYAEGLGLFGIKFAKKDCREASVEEMKAWLNNHNSVKFSKPISVKDLGFYVKTPFGIGILTDIDAGGAFYVEPINKDEEWSTYQFVRDELEKI